MKALAFLIFYGIFMLFVIEMSVLSGQSILSNTAGFEELSSPSGYDLINPLYIIPTLWALTSVSTEYTALTISVISPFIIGLVYIIASFIRGNSI